MARGAAQIYGKNIAKTANRMAKNQIAAARKPILADQEAARAALQGYGLAAGHLLQGIGPADQKAYEQAAQEESALAGGFAGQAADQVRQAQQGGQGFADQIGLKGADSQEQVKPEDLHNALYDLGGYIPGSSLESQGAAAAAWGNAQPAIQTARTEGDITQSDSNYAKQLLSIASQEPQLRQSLLHQLYGDALQGQAQNLVNAKFGEQVRVDNANIARGKALTRQGEARIKQGQVRLKIEGQNLVLRQQSQKLAVQKYLREGHTIDPSASRAAGYLVDGDGNPITTKNGKKIPYQTYSGTGKGGKNTGPGSTAYKDAYRYAASHYKTEYVAPGVPDPTQTRPPFAKMVNYLVSGYGVTRGQARKILISQGIKPDGKRP